MDAQLQMASSNLDHIYFFLAQPAPSQTMADEGTSTSLSTSPQKSRSRASSRGSNRTGSSTTLTGSASTTSYGLNPTATSFSPSKSLHTNTSLPSPVAHQVYDVRPVPGKGLGLVATQFISRGTRIISEQPLLRIRGTAPQLACAQYDKLSLEQKSKYDQLHAYSSDLHGLENISRLELIDYEKTGDDEDEIDRVTAEHVRIMSIFLVNHFNAPDGLATYAVTSRINHSCVPNAYHGYNPNVHRFLVHAVRDIAADEEITISYMGNPATYMVRSQRVEHLRSGFGFTCGCNACTDMTGTSNDRRELLNNICWGLEQYDLGAPPSWPFIAHNPGHAFRLAVNAVNYLNEEGLFNGELMRALCTASQHAMTLYEWESALDYALRAEDLQITLMGRELKDLIDSGTAASCLVVQVKQALRAAMPKKESDKILKKFRVKPRGAPSTQPEQKSPSQNTDPMPNASMSFGEKKKKKAKAKAREAEQRLEQAAGEGSKNVEPVEKHKNTEPVKNEESVEPIKKDAEDVVKQQPKQKGPDSWAKIAARRIGDLA